MKRNILKAGNAILQSMTDLDIIESLQQKARAREAQQQVKAPEEVTDKKSPLDGWNVLIVLGIVIGIFALAFLGFKAYHSLTASAVLSLDDLHQQNLDGNLEDAEGYVYNGFSFIKAEGLWWTEVNKFGTRLKIPLHFDPREVEEIPVSGSLDPRFNEGEEVFIAIDPNVTDKYYTLAISELSFNLVKGMDRIPKGSCTEENWACDNRTIISCGNANGRPVIQLIYGGEEKISLQGTCIKLQGSEYGLTKAVDRVLYQWYGVMKN